MSKKLVIVESPAKAKTIKNIFRKGAMLSPQWGMLLKLSVLKIGNRYRKRL